jgi:hypothetical protein
MELINAGQPRVYKACGQTSNFLHICARELDPQKTPFGPGPEVRQYASRKPLA